MFEGSEKKLEVFFSPDVHLLKNYSDSFWRQLCKKANIRILSSFDNAVCHSHILSESSLFIWNQHLLMLTCGDTRLVDSLIYLLKQFKQEDIEMIFYQRKNEFFPRKQKTSFVEDLGQITKKVSGKAFCFGNPDEHHFYLFHSDESYPIIKGDQTIEILMYDLADPIKNIFLRSQSAQEIREALSLDKIFYDTPIDDYRFSPCGYSLNGIHLDDESYYTIHVTPQNPGFYASFETNITQKPANEIIRQVLSIFKPFTMDVILFSSNLVPNMSIPDSFVRSSFFSKMLECGYQVQFSSFFRPNKYPRPPFILSNQVPS